MARPWRLAAVPEGSTDGANADHPPRGLYRDQIQTVSVSGVRRRSTTTFGHSGSSYSSASNSGPSNNSGYSSGSSSTVALERFGNQEELTSIARQMVREGFTQRMVQAFDGASPTPAFKSDGRPPDHALKSWFSELDVDWVLQIHDEHCLRRLLQEKPEWTPQDLVQKWTRALTVIAASITELVFAFQWTPVAALFGKASITEMLHAVDVIITVLQIHEKLRPVLDMFACVCGMSHMITRAVISPEARSIFNEIHGLLETEGNRLNKIIASTMKEVRTLVEEDDSWAIEISRGGGEVHNNTRFIMYCIASMTNAWTSVRNSAPSQDTKSLGTFIYGTIQYVEGMLFRKSRSLSDLSLQYMFLLNNSYFVAHVVSESSFIDELWDLELQLKANWKNYMDCYLDVSWGHVLSCITKSRFPGPIQRWIKTSSLAKFESAFHKTYQAQKFWKVPDPDRDRLRRAITHRVISGYRNYLQEHPELEKHVGRESSSPQVLQEMLGELFEG
ncbi:hypothetical protein ZWY2020_012076 [Hordeum vulgare]|nr:hypothetical protein ZWY2020_012076 [Hordeum vulgare]